MVLHAGCEDGFPNGCEVVFKSISTDGRDYHTEIPKCLKNWLMNNWNLH